MIMAAERDDEEEHIIFKEEYNNPFISGMPFDMLKYITYDCKTYRVQMIAEEDATLKIKL